MSGFEFKCDECGFEITVHSVTTKYVEGHGVCHAVFCDKCDIPLKLQNPKKGAPEHKDTTSW
tara:strand:+ start:392 stop:577 length:186 start_codon:yes stop_codon:yes gene_type:complete